VGHDSKTPSSLLISIAGTPYFSLLSTFRIIIILKIDGLIASAVTSVYKRRGQE
jgi:hypothetical protein